MPSRSRRPSPSSRASSAPPPKTYGQQVQRLQEEKPLSVQILFWMLIACLGLLTYALTPYTFNLDDIKVTILFCLFPVLLLYYFILLGLGRVPSPPRAVNIALSAYFAVMLLSTLFASHRWIGWYLIGFTLAGAGAYLAAVGVVRTRADLEKLVLGLVMICFGTVLFGLLHRYKFFSLIQSFVYGGNPPDADERLHGLIYTLAGADKEMLSTILNRDFFAAYLNMTIPLALGLAVATKSHWARILSIVTYGLGMLCILYTMSKNDWVIMAITPLLFLALYTRYIHPGGLHLPHWQHKYVIMLGIALILLTIAVLRWDLFSEKLKLFHGDELSKNVSSRLIIWRGSLDMFEDHPIIGVGPGSFRVLFPLYRNPNYFLNDISTLTLSAHNAYLDYLGETGILGFAAMMALLGLLGWRSLRIVMTSEDHHLRAIQAGIFCGFVGILLANLTSPFSRWAVGVGNFFGMLGVVAAGINTERFSDDAKLKKWQFQAQVLPPQQIGGFTLAGLSFLLLLFGFTFGVGYFTSAVANNKGLNYLNYPEGNVPDDEMAEILKEGTNYFEKAIAANPTFITGYYKLASAYHSLSRLDPSHREYWLDMSMKTYGKLSERAPDYSEIHYNYGIIYGDLADVALGKAEKATSAAERTTYMQEAIKDLENAAKEHAEGANQSTKLGAQIASASANESLADALDAFAEGQSAQAQELKKRAHQLREQSLAIYEKVLAYPPSRPDVKSEYPDGDPNFLHTRRSYALLLENLGRYKEAAQQLHTLLLQSPGDEAATRALSDALDKMKDDRMAEALLDELIQSNPVRVEYRLYRMRIMARQGRQAEAQKEAERIRRIQPLKENTASKPAYK